MKHFLVLACIVLASCSNSAQSSTTAIEPPATTAGSPTTAAVSTTTTTVAPNTTVAPAPTTTTTTTTATLPPATAVVAPGTYDDYRLSVRLAFRSEVADVSSSELQATALTILNSPDGWGRSGFEFVADAASELIVILAEGPAVDELCLPLDTGAIVNCQNGAVVALNADRWRSAFAEWDATLADYRTYVVNHEVGHLIGLRHPEERCPTADRVSALMEPQTTNLQGCTGNGIPLEWEIDWAKNRPAVVGPDPAWDGPRPRWPTETGG